MSIEPIEDPIKEPYIDSLIEELDMIIASYEGPLNAVDVAGVLLSRVTLLMTMHTEIGKGLVRYVWEKLDEIEQADPGNMI